MLETTPKEKEVKNYLLRLSNRVIGDPALLQAMLNILSISAIMLLLAGPETAMAAIDGTQFQQSLTQAFYGPWGLIGGMVILIIAVFAFLRFGMGMGVGIIVLGLFIFMIPALAQMFQAAGKGMSS